MRFIVVCEQGIASLYIILHNILQLTSWSANLKSLLSDTLRISLHAREAYCHPVLQMRKLAVGPLLLFLSSSTNTQTVHFGLCILNCY